MRGVELIDVHIYGELQNVVVNGVDIAPLVEAELNRRMPDREKMRPESKNGTNGVKNAGSSSSASTRASSSGGRRNSSGRTDSHNDG